MPARRSSLLLALAAALALAAPASALADTEASRSGTTVTVNGTIFANDLTLHGGATFKMEDNDSGGAGTYTLNGRTKRGPRPSRSAALEPCPNASGDQLGPVVM